MTSYSKFRQGRFKRQGRYMAVRGWYDENLSPTDKANGRWYFRSLLEVKCARYLNTLIKSGEPIVWRYGRKDMLNGHWDFNDRVDKPFKSNSQYTLDFEVSHLHTGETYWIEVKGALQGIAKIRRAVKHFPERELRVFTSEHGMEPVADYLRRLDMQKEFKKTGMPDLIEQVRKVRGDSLKRKE